MALFSFAARAERDIEAILDFTLSQWGSVRTTAYLDEIEDRCSLLAANPGAGAARDSIAKGLLCFPCGSHVLYYKQRGRGIVIVRVLHQAMDPVRHL